VNSNLILEEVVNYKGEQGTLLRNILKPLKVVSGNSVSEIIEKIKEPGIWAENQETRHIEKRVSQISYEGEVQTMVKKLEEDKDFEEIEEEEGTYLKRGEGTPVQTKGTPDKNRKIMSEKILDKNQSQWLVYKYDCCI
jgi:hypothetical protein